MGLSEKELKNYFKSNVGSKIRGFRGLKVGQEYTISGLSDDGNKVLIKEGVNTSSSNSTNNYYHHWRFEGVKVRKKFGEKHVGYIIKNEILDEREQFWKRKEEEEKRQQLNNNKNNIPSDRFNIQKMYQWKGWVYSVKHFVIISFILTFLIILVYLFCVRFDFNSLFYRFNLPLFIISSGMIILPFVFHKNVYEEVIEQLIIYKCINNKSRYRCSESKHRGLLKTQKNRKYYHHNFKVTKNGFHRFIGLKHGVDNMNHHLLSFTLVDSLDSDYYYSTPPTFEETIIVYLHYLDWYNTIGKQQVKFYD